MFNFFKKTTKSEPEKKLPNDVQVKLMLGDFDTQEMLEYLYEYDLSAPELNSLASGLRKKGEHKLSEDYYLKSITKDEKYGDPYGNLISLYCEQERFDDCEPIFNQGKEKACISRDFIFFHQARAYFIQEDYGKALTTATEEIDREPFENLYEIGIKSCLNMARVLKEGGVNEDEVKKCYTMGANMAKIAIDLFPESEDIKNLHEIFFED